MKPKLESLIQKYYAETNVVRKKMFRDMILKLDPKWKEIK